MTRATLVLVAAMILLILGPAAPGRVDAALVSVTGTETWDGVANPHAADGVTLGGSGTAADPYIYKIPDGMTITGGGLIQTLVNKHINFRFLNGDLQLDSGNRIDVQTGQRGATARLTLRLGNNDLTGSGTIFNSNQYVGPLDVSILGMGDVSLSAISLAKLDAGAADVNILAAGSLNITNIDTRDLAGGGGAGGNVTVRGGAVTLGNIDTASLRYTSPYPNGDVYLGGLTGPPFIPAWPGNVLGNHLTVNGVIDTFGVLTTAGGGNITLQGVKTTLGAGFGVEQGPLATLSISAGKVQYGQIAGDLFVDNSGGGFSATHDVDWSPVSYRPFERQSFDSAGEAAAAGWKTFNNTGGGNNFGFSNTDYTGLISWEGEAGGVFSRSGGFGYYGDTEIGGPWTRGNTIWATGEFDIAGHCCPVISRIVTTA